MKSPAVRFPSLALLGLVSLLFAGCSSDTKVTHTWTAPEVGAIKFNKVFILGFSPDNTTRRMAEVAVRDIITKVPVVCSFEPLPEIADIMIKEKVLKAVADTKADGAVVLRLLSKDTSITYSVDSGVIMGMEYYFTDSSNTNTAVPFYQNSASLYTNRIFAIEVGIFDVKTKKLIWKGQTQTTKSAVNVGDINSLVTEIAETVRSKLQSQGLLN
jgi:hypothetical protein